MLTVYYVWISLGIIFIVWRLYMVIKDYRSGISPTSVIRNLQTFIFFTIIFLVVAIITYIKVGVSPVSLLCTVLCIICFFTTISTIRKLKNE